MSGLTTATSPTGTPPGYYTGKAGLTARLARIEGQVRGVARMVDSDRYCIDVLTQISAISRALQEVALGLLDDHVRHCLLDAAHAGPGEADEKLSELSSTFRRTLRL